MKMIKRRFALIPYVLIITLLSACNIPTSEQALETPKGIPDSVITATDVPTETPANELNSDGIPTAEGTFTEIPQEISSVIDQYFDIVKNGIGDTTETRLLLQQAFPNFSGDELSDGLQYYLEEKLINDFSYEIVVANQYSMDQADAKRMWATLIEEEIGTGIPDPDAFAEIIVELTMKAQDNSMDGVVEYCDILLVQDNGTWGVFFVEDSRSERPKMYFPF